MLGSVTVLPAMLSFLSRKGWTEKGRVPWVAKRRHKTRGESRVWGAILDRVLKRPLLSVVLAGGLLLALSIPAFSMHTVNPGVTGLPRSLEVMQTYDKIDAAFPGGGVPAVTVVKADDVTTPEVQGAIADLKREAIATGELDEPTQRRDQPRQDRRDRVAGRQGHRHRRGVRAVARGAARRRRARHRRQAAAAPRSRSPASRPGRRTSTT